jgi:predicted dehydrogenase/nucleoside-diphosphate-sugar epimerase
MSEFLRVALLGGGKMAHQHAAAIRQCRGAKLVAVVDPAVPSDELKTRFGADVVPYSDAQEMLAAVKPDVVHVVTPPATHAPLAGICLVAGANVYVEKPFALTSDDAQSVLRLADSKGLRVCAAHQVLFQDAGRAYRQHLPMIDGIAHVESFFSFRPVRKRAGGGGLSTPVDQLIDILPHPVYLLLDALPAESGVRAEVTALDISIDGEVRAVVRRGNTLATLVVSLNARPVESWLRVMGRNGMVEADFVLGTIIRHPGPGSSAPSVVLKPFSRSWQVGWGSFKAVLKLIFRRHKSYPGLAELLELFYASIRERTPTPISAAEITDTVRICEAISTRLHSNESAADEQAARDLMALEAQLPPLNDRGVVLLTGGTGMLGRPTAQLLRASGWRVRVPVRRKLSPRQQLPGIEYVSVDLAESIPDSLLEGVETVVHLAAETAGTKADHERNTIQATRNLLNTMARTGTRRLVNVSSVAVLKPSRLGRPLCEDSPVDYDNLKRGPYVWAKAEAENLAIRAAQSGSLDVRTVRLGPLVDYDNYAAPGRLGREVARLFVAMGRPSNHLSVCNVTSAAEVLCHYVRDFDSCPNMVNLLEVPATTRRQLVSRLRHARPDLRLLWLPFWILRIMSMMFSLIQKLLSPSSSALDLYAAFASEAYSSDIANRVLDDAGCNRTALS